MSRRLLASGTLAFLAGAVLLGAAGCASRATVPEPSGYWTGPINSDVPASISGGRVVDAHGLAALLARERAVVVDASNAPVRPDGLASGAPWLPLPHPAIPGSLWIPGSGLAAITEPVDHYFRERLAEATGGDRDFPVVLYCHERCWLSWNAAKRAIEYGYSRVYWFPEGIEGWRAAGLATAVIEPEGPGAGETAGQSQRAGALP